MRRIARIVPAALILALPAVAMGGPPSLPEEDAQPSDAPAEGDGDAAASEGGAASPDLSDPNADPVDGDAGAEAGAEVGGSVSMGGGVSGDASESGIEGDLVDTFDTPAGPEAETGTTPDASAESSGDGISYDGDMTGPGTVRGRKEPMANTLRGGTGLFYTALPDVGGDKTFRFRLHTDFYRSKGRFLSDTEAGLEDTNSRLRGSVNIGFTPWKYLDMWLAVSSSANRNERDKPDRQDPTTVFALGDTEFGIKGAYPFKDGGIGLGGQLYMGLLSGSGRLLTERVNFGFDVVFGVDLRHLTAKNVPVRFAANVGWLKDNSSKLVDWASISDPLSREVLRYGLGANNSRVRTRWAVDFPVRLGKEKQFGLDPFVEFSWDIATEEVDAFRELTASIGEAPLPRSSNWLTLGLRANVIAGLFLDAGVDIGTAAPNFEYGPPTAPYQIVLGLGYSANLLPIVKKVEVGPEAPPVPPPVLDGRIVGTVVDASGNPVAGAKVRFPGRAANDMLTDANGSFTSWRFTEGEIPVQVELADGTVIDQSAAVVPNEDTRLDIQLGTDAPAGETPAGEPAYGLVDGTFTGEGGAGVKVSMQIQGMGIDEAFESNDSGRIALELPAGEYTAILKSAGYEDKTINFVVQGESVVVQEQLSKGTPAETPNVKGSTSSIRVRKKIRYDGDGLDPKSNDILDELAAFLKSHPEYELVQIQVHTDDQGNPRARSQGRADAIKAYLVGKGVAGTRLDAKGFGDSSPVAVNLTPDGRAKNNRTNFRVKKHSGK